MSTPSAPTRPPFAVGSLVAARGREWVVLPESDAEALVVRPLGGGEDDTAAILPALEEVEPATFPPPTVDDLGDSERAGLLRTALRIGFRSSAGPFRSLGALAVEPRAYQYVPLLMALRQQTVRLLIADDVGIGKTIEAGLIAAELFAQGDAERLAVLCSPALAEQWQHELRDKFQIDAQLVLPATVARLERGLQMNQSVFTAHRAFVISTDFIKQHTRRMDFLNHCPDLVIVDEAHTAVADGGMGGARTERYDLLRQVAAEPSRHLLLVTATPHSGKEQGFRNLLGLLHPDLERVNLEDVRGRELLARHFVQRRRADVRRYIDEDTAFPSDRLTRDVEYSLSPEYRRFFERVLAYARERVREGDGGGAVRQRVRWWSALALLRASASSPAAAEATLRARAAAAAAADAAEADRLGRAAVLDAADDEALEGIDLTPGALLDDPAEPGGGADEVGEGGEDRRRLHQLAREAAELAGAKRDRKLATLVREVKGLIGEGDNPIVFCRFIDTAEYVAAALEGKVGKGVAVAAVTGRLPAALREERVAELAAGGGAHVLVATDCLSEGVNLQDHFQAVIHYDLAWNPTRHEQREGRVDRFGQRRDVVRAVTLYGADNGIDGIVLDVLLRKHREIRRATGVSVPVPDESDGVVNALMEGLLLRGADLHADQLTLDVGVERERERLHREWQSAAERERTSRTKYAQETIKPQAAVEQARLARGAVGSADEVARFATAAFTALGGVLGPPVDGARPLTTTALPAALRDAFPPGLREPLPLHEAHPVPRGAALLARTDPVVGALARHVLDTALDPHLGQRVAHRAGVARTSGLTTRTTLLLLRLRFHLDLPARGGQTRRQVTEEARLAAFTGRPHSAVWLADEEVEALLDLRASGNLTPELARDTLEGMVRGLPDLAPALDELARARAAALREDHRRVRAGAGAARRGLEVRAQTPVDVLGIYTWLPQVGA